MLIRTSFTAAEMVNSPYLALVEYLHTTLPFLSIITALYCFDSTLKMFLGYPAPLPNYVRVPSASRPSIDVSTPICRCLDPFTIIIGGVILGVGYYCGRSYGYAAGHKAGKALKHEKQYKDGFGAGYHEGAVAQQLADKTAKETAGKATDTVTAVADKAGKADAATPMQANFQTPASDIGTKINDLHHDLMFFLVAIVVFVSYVLVESVRRYRSDNTTTSRVAFAHHTLLEKV
jgi:hypothetical protein